MSTAIKPFFSEAQLHQLREVTMSGLVTPVTIKRRSTSDSDYGDAEVVTWTTVLSTKGWVFSTPTPVQQPDSGAVITVNTYRLYLPVGLDVRPGDQAFIGSDTYIISDTTGESTWQAMIVCSLRKRE